MTRRLHVVLAVALLAVVAGSCVPPGGNQALVAQASATPSVGPAPLTVLFSAAGSSDPDGSIVSFFWQFGDGGTSTLANPTHTFTGVSVYAATLTVTDNAGATGTTTITVEATAPNQSPEAQASATPTSGTAPLTVAFSSTGSTDPDGTITSYSWDFGDSAGTSTNANPSYTYTAPGAYVALLTVTDDDGATNTASVAITVGSPPANVAPTAVLNGSPLTGKVPLLVSFDSTESLDPDGTIVSESLDFGDASALSSTGTVDHTYTLPGTYTATLTVTDDDGAIGTDTVTIEVAANVPPTAAAQATPTSGLAPLAVDFTSTGSDDSDGTIASYSWDFGDGGSATGPAPSHTYAIGGVYTATLTVTDDDGATDTDTVTINAIGTTISPSSGPAPSTITVTVPCSPEPAHPDVATAIVALVTSPGGTVVSTASFDNSSSGDPDAVFTLDVPAGTAAGSYEVTSSCDTYMDSVQYAPVPFTVI